MQLRPYALHSLEEPTMSEHNPVITDLQQTVDELRNAKLEAKMTIALLESFLAKAYQERDEWRELCERSLNQIEEWKAVCEKWEARYNEMIARNN